MNAILYRRATLKKKKMRERKKLHIKYNFEAP